MSSPQRVQGFDGLRAVGALMVYAEHKIHGSGLGATGVYIFFALSGFLITGILHRQRLRVEQQQSTWQAEMRSFWDKRVRRIFPVYFLALAIVAAMFAARGEAHAIVADGLVPWYLVFCANLFIEYVKPVWNEITHVWSIAVEQQFYFLAAPLLLLLPAHRHARLMQAMLGASLLYIAYSVATHAHPKAFYVSAWVNFCLMAAGGWLALRAFAQDAPWLRAPGGLLAAAAGAIALTWLLQHSRLGSGLTDLQLRAAKVLLGLIAGPALVAYVARCQQSLLTRALSWWPLQQIGVISYGLYVYHLLIPEVHLGVHWVDVAAHLALCLAAATLSWRWMERPLLSPRKRANPVSTGAIA